ncbi:hypothetical protein DFS34DRAFT_66946 [Phlyctochytrium arcticum]|nr:hypothetical protein DFS34DRAFT_66946 [Phlyctochytrium arcticum]
MANIGQMDVPPNIGLNAADGMVIYLRLASQWTTVYREYQPIPWAQTISAIATAFQILLLTGLMFLFGQGRFSPYGLLHRILPGADHTTYLPVGSDEMSKFRFFVNEYLDTTPLGIAAVGLGYAPPPRKRPLPVTAVSVLALLFLLASFIMYLLALFGGNGDLFVKNISFLDITKTTQPVETRTTLGLGLWGYCSKSAKAHHCTEATMTELFQSFDFNSTVLGPDAFPSKTNAVDFVLLLGASVFMAIALFSRMISFWLRSLNGTSDVVAPATSSVALLSGFVAFATLIAYYTNIKHNVESWGEGWIGHLGIGVTLVGCAVLLNIISAVLLFWELRIMRQKERDMKEWKRESFARESMSNDASATATQYDVPKNDNPA